MKKIYTIGETLCDIILEDLSPQAVKPGGAMLNSSVSLGRLGLDVSLISELGSDRLGDIIDQFLIKNGVDTSYIFRFKGGKTPLALAFLDENKNATYSFYKHYPENRLDISLPHFKKGDIVLFGSFFALSNEVRKPLKQLLTAAKQSEALIIYDPNFRKSHLDELEKVLPFIRENISISDIVRGSDEDFQFIFNAHSAIEAYKEVENAGCSTLIYTDSSKEVVLFRSDFQQHYPVPEISVKSTIGAGDNFNAGIIYGLIEESLVELSQNIFQADEWERIINNGIKSAQAVCESFENYIPQNFSF